MKSRFSLCALLTFAVVHFGCLAEEPAFTPLFNGVDLTNFKQEDAKEFWRIENGVLVGENNAALKGNNLWTEKEYSDFILEFDARWKEAQGRILHSEYFSTHTLPIHYGDISFAA